MAPAWCAECGAWRGSPSAYGETTLSVEQVVTLATLVRSPGSLRSRFISQEKTAARCASLSRCIAHAVSSDASTEGVKREQRWDNGRQKRSLRSPDFWRNNCYKPAVADTTEFVTAASLSTSRADQLASPGYENRSTPEFVKKLCKQGQVKEAVEVLEILVETSPAIDKYLLYYVLKECVARKNLMLGGQVHALAVKMGFGSDTFLCTHLIRMYAAYGKLREAMDVFTGVALPDAFMWSSIISAYAKQGQAERAIELYHQMRATRITPDNYVFVAALQACAAAGDLRSGKQIHSDIEEHSLESNVLLDNSLVNMYAKCGSLRDARIVFDGLRDKNVVTWNAMISGYAQQQGMGQEALNIYSAMRNEGMAVPDRVTFVCLLQACANMGVSALEKGKQLHAEVKERGVESDVAVGGSLVNMYAKCGSLRSARTVFDGLHEKNVVTWNALIAGYAQQEGIGQDALSLYSAMCNEGMVVPDAVTYVCLLQACANEGVSALVKGKQLHSDIKERGVQSDLVVGASLVNMYAKCGSLRDARIVFDGLHERDVVTWSAMIAGYAQQEGMGQEALSLHSAMRNEGMVVPNAVTFACLLQACANVGVSALAKGKQLHSEIKERGVQSDVVLGASLVNMYAKCGSLQDARIVFDGLREKDVVTWSAMIAGYAQQEGMGKEAISLHSAMRNDGMVVPNAVTFVCLLQACANMGISALEKGKQLLSEIKERGVQSDVVIGASLVNMYAKCGSVEEARIVFDGLREKDVVTWSAMIAGYAQQEGMGQESLSLYSAMRNEGMVVPDAVTFLCLLQACASVAALQQGKELHSEIRDKGLECDALIGTSLVNMYAQCGCLEISRQIFDRLPMKRVDSWNALINGYAEHAEGGMAVQCFEELLEQGIQPNDVTYICLLAACSRAGLVEEGQRYFDTMELHGVKPDERHYSCMVDLLGRSGHLGRAEEMLLGVPSLAGSDVSWTALLSACKSYDDVDLGRRCFEHLVKLQPNVSTAYVLLASIYGNAGRWEEVQKVEILRKAAGAMKKAAIACIEVKKEVHKFTVGEKRSDIAETLRNMNTRVKEGGHVPQTQLVLRAVSEQEKEDALCGHAEKLALAFGLLNTPAGSTLVVTKNLRMCNDCHSSTKIMSRVEKREIVVRDGNKVHRFQNGACSCQDKP